MGPLMHRSFKFCQHVFRASQIAQWKRICLQEMQVQFLCWEDPLEKEKETHSVFLPGNPKDQGAWWATINRVAKSWTWLNDWAHTQTHFLLTVIFLLCFWEAFQLSKSLPTLKFYIYIYIYIFPRILSLCYSFFIYSVLFHE